MTVMRDVAISKSEFVPGENAVTKVQNFQDDPVLFEYCRHPEVRRGVVLFSKATMFFSVLDERAH